MQQKAPDELCGFQRHYLAFVSVGVVLVSKRHATMFHRQQPSIGDGNPMRVERQILQSLRGPAKGWLHKDNPFDPLRLLAHRFKCGRSGKAGHLTVKLQVAFPK
jgi:hypothetical protein